MICLALVIRSLGIGTRRLLQVGAAILVVVAISAILGPGRTLIHQASYTITSSVLSTKDASSSQRVAELQNFKRNVHGTQWITGRGVGVLWRAKVPSPIDRASFGSEENGLTRIGWHVYGLDWTYKFGLLGVALILATAFVLGRRVYRSCRAADADARWLTYSLAVCAPPLRAPGLLEPAHRADRRRGRRPPLTVLRPASATEIERRRHLDCAARCPPARMPRPRTAASS